jgi:hypothetical protein
MPIGGRSATAKWPEIEAACEKIGRDPSTVEIGVFTPPPDEEVLTELAGRGVMRAVFALPQGPRDEVLEALETFAPLVDKMRDA